MDSCPQSLKKIRPYLIEATKLEEIQPLISHYTYVYALQRGIRERDPKDTDAASFIKALLTDCEKNRAKFADNIDEHRQIVEDFSLMVYQRADRVFMDGNANATTVQHFLAAEYFIDVSSQFGELSKELSARRKSARMYAGMIAKSLREGKQPVHPLLSKQQQQGGLESVSAPIIDGGAGNRRETSVAPAATSETLEPVNQYGIVESDRDIPPPPVADYGPRFSTQSSSPSASLYHPVEPSGEAPRYGMPTSDHSYPDSAPSYPTFNEPVPPPLEREAEESKGAEYFQSDVGDERMSVPPRADTNQFVAYQRPESNLVEFEKASPERISDELSSSAPHSEGASRSMDTDLFHSIKRDPASHTQISSSRKPVNTSEPASRTACDVLQFNSRNPGVHASVSRPVAPVPSTTPKTTPDFKAIGLAQKRAKFAVSALDFQDVSTAISELQEALRLLQG